MRLFTPIISLFLTPLVAVMPLRAELAAGSSISTSGAAASVTAAATGETTPGQSNLLKIRLADDSKATVEASGFVKGYAILVTDAAGLPVPDAAVAVRLPDEGATGAFINGEHSAVAYTDASGVAKFPQVSWGATLGTASVRVTAVKGDLHAGALIEQTVVAQGHASPKTAPAPAVVPPAVPVPVPSPSPTNTATVTKPAEPSAKTPGVPTSVAAVHSGAGADSQSTGTTETAAATEPAVSIVNTSGSKGGSGNTKKWVILAAVIAGAGIGAALALSGKGAAAASTGASSTTTIGTPSVSIGH